MSLPIFDLSGKVAVVTGGYWGIGFGVAQGLAEAGAEIVICARTLSRCQEAAAEIEKLGVRVLPIKCDISDVNEVENLIGTTVKEFGKIDIMVNNAGVGGSSEPTVRVSDDDWNQTIDINLSGAFYCSRAAAREMIKRKEGKIINVSSIAASYVFPRMTAYCVSKAGIVQLTRVMAHELARYNIQVNAILPGYFETPINREFFASEAGKKVIERDLLLKRLGDIQEIKGVAIYLASPASSFTTGASFVVDGGQSLR